ncbi:MAG: CoA transferase subunit A [Saprospiraceae bacterium]|nr:CoA transferase subunit A [Saprospiraceae bacterium]
MDSFNKVVEVGEVASKFFHGMTLMFGGFGGVGTPPTLIDCLIESEVSDVHLIGNDAGFPWIGIGKFVVLGRAASLIASHIGSNPVAGQLMQEGKLAVEFSPQGILVERMRAGGSGIPGFASEVGIGTKLSYEKPVLDIDGKEYLFESALTADVGIVHAGKADRYGNLVFNKTAQNTNPYVAMASQTTIVEAEQIVEVGSLEPDEIHLPGIYIDFIIPSEGINWKWVWET